MALVGALLGAGVSVHEADATISTATHCAASHGHEGVCRLLVGAGADGRVPNGRAQAAHELMTLRPP